MSEPLGLDPHAESALRPRALDSEAEHLIGLLAIRERIAILGKGAETEVMTLAPGGARPADALVASRGPTMDLFERGVRTRAVHMDSARRHQLTLDHLPWLESQGEQVRDRRVAVLPADTGDDHSGAGVVRGEGTVAARSRFEAGVHAVQDGWLPPTR